MLKFKTAAAAALSMIALITPAFAHHPMGGATPSTFTEGLLSGLGHPIIGLDHLAFVIGVGLMALMLPAGRSMFNVAAAQGDRTDRSLMSYIRGSYGSGHDGTGTHTLNKRKGAVVSALRALYRADDSSEITLAALMWTTQSGNALADLKEPVDRFFDDVMVMADDDAVKNNRLALLGELRSLFLDVADISRLSLS